jgi:hypothetical protein
MDVEFIEELIGVTIIDHAYGNVLKYAMLKCAG